MFGALGVGNAPVGQGPFGPFTLASILNSCNKLVRIAREFGRPIATAQQAREISQIGVFHDTVEETLRANGFAPNRNGGQQGFLRKAA